MTIVHSDTLWKPNLDPASDKPRYQGIADAIARDVASGSLPAGSRLPTHRDLARFLGVTVGTVSRGYAEAERRGLTVGEVGRGTFIRERKDLDEDLEPDTAHIIDLSLNMPVRLPEERESRLLADTLAELSTHRHLDTLLRYKPNSATLKQRRIAASWVSRLGLETRAEDILVTAGAQHGLNILFATLMRPGDVILTGELTYPGVKPLASMFGLRLQGLPMDAEGILPESFDLACRSEQKPTALYCIPTLQNPTCGTLSEERRREIAEIAERHQIWVLEDDVHAGLHEENPTPIANFARPRTIYLASVSKCLNPGLRIGFIVALPALRERMLSSLRSTLWMPPPLMTEITCRWLSDGTAEAIMAEKRKECRLRQELAARYLGRFHPKAHPDAYHLWLTLPSPWRSDELVNQARQRCVRVAGGGAFAVGRDLPHAVRLSLGNVADRGKLEQGLRALADILTEGSDPCVEIV